MSFGAERVTKLLKNDAQWPKPMNLQNVRKATKTLCDFSLYLPRWAAGLA